MANYIGIENGLKRVSVSLTKVAGIHFNTILVFAQASGQPVQNELGNYTLPSITTQEVQAKFMQVKPPETLQNPGQDTARTYMEGYLVEPVKMEGFYLDNLECRLLQDGIWITGKFSFVDCIPSTLKENFGLTNAFGQRVKGWFERNAGTL